MTAFIILIILTILTSLLIIILCVSNEKHNHEHFDNIDNNKGYFWQQACLESNEGLDPSFFCVDDRMFIHDDGKCINLPKPTINPYMCQKRQFNLTPSKDLKKCKDTPDKIIKNVYSINKIYEAGKKNFDLTTNRSDVPLETPINYPIVSTDSDFTENTDKKEISIAFQNRMCWLSEDLNNPITKELPYDVYPLKLNCHQRGDKFRVQKQGKAYVISKEIDGKTCYLTYSLDGTNRGFGYGNAVLSCNPDHDKFKDMVMSRCGNHYKIHPKLRKRCYLKSYETDRGIIPIFHCYSTPLSAITIGDKVSFV